MREPCDEVRTHHVHELEDTTMTAGGPHRGQHDVPVEGPPSARARAGLAADLRREVADARVRLEEAGLRAEAHRLLGDQDGAADVVREQEAILAEVQDRLGRAVSAAVVQRDAEQVLADLTDGAHPARPAPAVEAGSPGPRPVAAAPDRPRSPALAGVASMVAVLGVAVAAVLGLVRGLDPVSVDEVSADAVPRVGVDGTVVDPAPPVGPGSVPPAEVGTEGADVAPPSDVPSAPAAPVPTTRAATPADDPTDGAAVPTPTPGPGLGPVVRDLIDAVAGLDAPGPADPPTEVDSSVPGLDELLEQLLPDLDEDPDPDADVDPVPAPDPTPGPTDGGFVPAPSAQ